MITTGSIIYAYRTRNTYALTWGRNAYPVRPTRGRCRAIRENQAGITVYEVSSRLAKQSVRIARTTTEHPTVYRFVTDHHTHRTPCFAALAAQFDLCPGCQPAQLPAVRVCLRPDVHNGLYSQCIYALACRRRSRRPGRGCGSRGRRGSGEGRSDDHLSAGEGCKH
jgi:hypothetical protein